MVYYELQDLRRRKDACLLVSAELIQEIPQSVFLDAALKSLRAPSSAAAVNSNTGAGTAMSGEGAGDGGEGGGGAAAALAQSVILKKQRGAVPLPGEFAYQLPSDGRGCHRLAFSPASGRYLAAAVELKDQSFEIRVFDLARQQLHCVCHGHRDLVYDLFWIPNPADGNSAAGARRTGGKEDAAGTTEDVPGCLVTASSDGTAIVFQIPRDREPNVAIAPAVTMYHPSYCYSARPFLPSAAMASPLDNERFYLVVGGHTFGLKVWRVARRDMNYRGPEGTEGIEPDWRVTKATLCTDQPTQDRSHVTCIRFGREAKSDIFYATHSAGYISSWRCVRQAVGPGGAAPIFGGQPTQDAASAVGSAVHLQIKRVDRKHVLLQLRARVGRNANRFRIRRRCNVQR
ncbi:unnamed protein product [Amoebophrya sp. A25]|nr:unnamed protein product [Amoebophrya sp. A25]|eukprot:GSA25T00022532001.1